MRYLQNFLSVFGLILLLANGAKAETITPQEAAQNVGQSVVVEGVVRQISRSRGGTVFVNFGGRYPNHVFRGGIPITTSP